MGFNLNTKVTVVGGLRFFFSLIVGAGHTKNNVLI